MNLDAKLGYLVLLEVFTALSIAFLIFILDERVVSSMRLWEIFPAFLAAALTIFGLKEMRKRT